MYVDEKLLTTAEAAKRADVAMVTVRQARRTGRLPAADKVRRGNRMEYLYRAEDVDRAWPREEQDSEVA